MNWLLEALSTPEAAALFAVCSIGIIVAGVIAGCAAGANDALAQAIAAARAKRGPAMRTANSSLINRQVRDLQRSASDTRR